jgi:tRNA (guanine-N7-)-methyltransferase
MTTPNAKKTIDDNFCYRSDFKYTHDNPYHDKLGVFDSFVLRDEEAETNVGKWNERIFQNTKPVEVEIGTGYGEFMMEYCQKNPDINFIGLDHRFKRSFSVAKKLDKLEHKNFRYLRARGERIEFMFDESEIQSLFYFFPDPWPKARHHKRRLVQPERIQLMASRVRAGGAWNIATDWEPYAEHIEEMMATQPQWAGGKIARPSWRPITHYESIGLSYDRVINDFEYQRTQTPHTHS